MGSEIRHTTDKQKRDTWRWIVKHIYELLMLAILLSGLILFSLHRNYNTFTPIDSGLWGQFGDYIGGIIGSLIAYLSVRLLNKNLQEQVEANKAIRQNNEYSRKVFELQQFDKTFTTLVELYNEKKKTLEKIELVKELETHRCKEDIYKERVEGAKNVFSRYYATDRSVLSAYFRLLYRVMQTIGDANVEERVKFRYAKTFRCLLTEEELILMRYNAMTDYGHRMQAYINRYNLLKHLPLMRLSEFNNNEWVNTLSPEYKDLFDNIFWDIRTFLVHTFCQVTNEEEKFENKYKGIDGRTFRVTVELETYPKNSVRVLVEYVAGKLETMQDIKDEVVSKLLEYFMYEMFAFISFECYQKVDQLKVDADSLTEKNSRKHGIWARAYRPDGYRLILSQRQLDKPKKG